MDKRELAKRLLSHYFSVAYAESGADLPWDSLSEIESIVDLIIDAAKEEIIKEIKENVN